MICRISPAAECVHQVKRDAMIGEAEARRDATIAEAKAEEQRMEAKLKNDTEIARFKALKILLIRSRVIKKMNLTANFSGPSGTLS